MTITQNLTLILNALGIQGVQFLEELPDRVRALDTLGQLQKHIDEHPEHWMHDVYDPLHGKIAASYREKARPSMQVCTHPISQVNHPPERMWYELDVDLSPPDSLPNFLRHTAEVGSNFIRHRLTNETDMALALQGRFQKEHNA